MNASGAGVPTPGNGKGASCLSWRLFPLPETFSPDSSVKSQGGRALNTHCFVGSGWLAKEVGKDRLLRVGELHLSTRCYLLLKGSTPERLDLHRFARPDERDDPAD